MSEQDRAGAIALLGAPAEATPLAQSLKGQKQLLLLLPFRTFGGRGAQAQWGTSGVGVVVEYQVALCPGRRSQGAEVAGSSLLTSTSVGGEKFVNWASKFWET